MARTVASRLVGDPGVAGTMSRRVSATMRTSVSRSVKVEFTCSAPSLEVTRQLILRSRSPGRNSRTSARSLPSPRRRERCIPTRPIGWATPLPPSSVADAGRTVTVTRGTVVDACQLPLRSRAAMTPGPTS